VRQFDGEALDSLVVQCLAVDVADAEAPYHLFKMLELIVEDASRAGSALLSAAHDVAFNEQLRSVRSRAIGKAENRASHNNRNGECFHGSFLSPRRDISVQPLLLFLL